jgi:hypothetical protein
MLLNLRQSVIELLKRTPEQSFSARQIAVSIFESQREACEEKRRRSKQDLSDDAELLQQLVAEIGANRKEIQKKEPRVRTTDGRPRRYYFTLQSDTDPSLRVEHLLAGDEASALPTQKSRLSEQDLYPLLCRYLNAEFDLYPKRIDEKRATNRHGPNGNRWLFPDIVTLEDLSRDWQSDIRECVRAYGDSRCRLWSFEVKLKLNRANVREAWFQTVSNSSWSNFGYLVAAEVEDSAMQELRLLAAAHGIGLIILDTQDPTEGSEVRIPGRERLSVDWDSCNRLAEENADFRDYIRLIRQFHQTGDIRARDWDLPEID